jgi:hypothetical protein
VAILDQQVPEIRQARLTVMRPACWDNPASRQMRAGAGRATGDSYGVLSGVCLECPRCLRVRGLVVSRSAAQTLEHERERTGLQLGRLASRLDAVQVGFTECSQALAAHS